MNKQELNDILAKHKVWMESGHKDGERGYLCYKDMSCMDLSGYDFSGVDIFGADLSSSDLSYTKMVLSNLENAFLANASLYHAEMTGAVLKRATLHHTDLRFANIADCDMSFSNLIGSDMSNSIICGTNMQCAHLEKAKLNDVQYDIYSMFFQLQCPEEGPYIAYKKAGSYIAKLLIPDDAKRSSATSRVCRANKVVVLDILNTDRTPAGIKICHSNHDNKFVYEIGNTISVDDFDDDRWNERGAGIRHFITFEEAVNGL